MNSNKRYQVIAEHNPDWAPQILVVDTFEDPHKIICECYTTECANMIAKALNE